jgi:hypothetical protein
MVNIQLGRQINEHSVKINVKIRVMCQHLKFTIL